MTTATFTPGYERWRHGGWYVWNVHYPSGAVGCVSRNYDDYKWRIVCDKRPNAYALYTYRSRDEAARAEYELAEAEKAIAPKCPTCGDYEQRHARERGWCYGCGADCATTAASRTAPTLHPTHCQDCGIPLVDYPYGQVPLCYGGCREQYEPAALRAWIVWLMRIDE